MTSRWIRLSYRIPARLRANLKPRAEVIMELAVGVLIGAVVGFLAARLLGQIGTGGEDQQPGGHAVGDESTRAIRSSLEALDLGILLYDSSGGEMYRNPAGRFESFRRPTQAIINGEVQDLVAAMVDSELREPVEREVDLYGPPRSALLLRGLPSVVADDRGFVVIVDDVTRERQLQEVRRAFVSNVSHELRTPVGAIAVLAETLAATDDPATVTRLSDRLSTAAHRLGDMIEDLLELSRTETSGTAQDDRVAVNDIVDGAVRNLAEPARVAQVVVTTAVVPADLSVTGDRRQLRSALQNLLDNAIKYSEPGGEIAVSAELRGGQILISVADQGIGIPATDLDRVFERFYRVDTARRRDTGGTGLGLSIVRHVVINHGGDVTVTSVEGEGTTFVIELPQSRLADHPSNELDGEPADV
ncbi:MAG: sensor histidine kinase [Acidimicrobiales bacterium]